MRTGQTIYENILSLDADNNPVSGATFDSALYKDGAPYTSSTVFISLIDDTRGLFTASWSSSTIGTYQLYTKNLSTNVIFVSEPVNLRPDSEFDQNIYIGL